MAAVVGRIVLGVCALVAVVSGAALVVKGVVYFGADEYLSELEAFQDGLFAGVAGLGIYVGGAFRAHVAARIAAGVGAAFGGFVASVVVAAVVSLAADRGGPRGNLEDAAVGFIWFLAGAYFAWCVVTRRWPVSHPDRRSGGGQVATTGGRRSATHSRMAPDLDDRP